MICVADGQRDVRPDSAKFIGLCTQVRNFVLNGRVGGGIREVLDQP